MVPRGAGTSLSGGALPLADGVLLGMAKFNRIREIDFANRVAVVEPGVTNLAVTQAVEHAGLLLRARSVLADRLHHRRQRGGEFRRRALPQIRHDHQQRARLRAGADDAARSSALGGKHLDAGGYDLLGVITGSEGLLGVVTEVTVRILKKPECARAVLVGFASSEDAGECVEQDHRRRHHPRRHGDDGRAGDPCGRGIRACRLSARRRGAADRRGRRSARRGRSPHRPRRGDRQVLPRRDLPRLQFRGRAAVVLGRPQGGVPGGRPHLARLLLHGRHHPAGAAAAGARAHARAVGATTGCASPTSSMPATAICIRSFSTTPTSRASSSATEEFGADILRLCVEVGGVLTGEHGVGVEKRDLMPAMFSEADLEQQQRLKCAFDDKGLLNPGKVFPTLHRCAELGRMHVHAGRVAVPGHCRRIRHDGAPKLPRACAGTELANGCPQPIRSTTPRTSSRRCNGRWPEGKTAGDRRPRLASARSAGRRKPT